MSIALANRRLIRFKAQPMKILDDGLFVFGARSNLIVIFKPQEHPSTKRAGHAPHRDGAGDVAQVKKPGRGGSEPGDEAVRGRSLKKQKAQRFTAMPITSKRAPKRRAPDPRKARAGNSFVK